MLAVGLEEENPAMIDLLREEITELDLQPRMDVQLGLFDSGNARTLPVECGDHHWQDL